MKTANYKWEICDNIIVSCVNDGAIAPDVWKKFIKDLNTPLLNGYLGATIGSVEVTSLQRKEIFEITKGKGFHVAVVSDDRLVRGIVTAANWVGVDVKAYSWEDLPQAPKYLGLTEDQSRRAIEVVMRLKFAITGVRR